MTGFFSLFLLTMFAIIVSAYFLMGVVLPEKNVEKSTSWFNDPEGLGNVICVNMTKPDIKISMDIKCNTTSVSPLSGVCTPRVVIAMYRAAKSNRDCECTLNWDLMTSIIWTNPTSQTEKCSKMMKEIEMNQNTIFYHMSLASYKGSLLSEYYNPFHNLIEKCLGEDREENAILFNYGKEITISVMSLHIISILSLCILIYFMRYQYDYKSILMEFLWMFGDIIVVCICIYLIITFNTALDFDKASLPRSKRETRIDTSIDECMNKKVIMVVNSTSEGITPADFFIKSNPTYEKTTCQLATHEKHPCTALEILDQEMCNVGLKNLRMIVPSSMGKFLSEYFDRAAAESGETTGTPPNVTTSFKGLNPRILVESTKLTMAVRSNNTIKRGIHFMGDNLVLASWWQPVADSLPWSSIVGKIVEIFKQCFGSDSGAHMVLIKNMIVISVVILSYNIGSLVYILYEIWDEYKSLQNVILLVKCFRLILALLFCVLGSSFLFIEVQTRNVINRNE